MRTSAKFDALQDGTSTSLPTAVTSSGEVTTVHPSSGDPSVTLVGHTAQIGHGNSGGPLVDRCGFVAGVNTFGVEARGDEAAFALSAGSLATVLTTWGVQFEKAPAPCPSR